MTDETNYRLCFSDARTNKKVRHRHTQKEAVSPNQLTGHNHATINPPTYVLGVTKRSIIITPSKSLPRRGRKISAGPGARRKVINAEHRCRHQSNQVTVL